MREPAIRPGGWLSAWLSRGPDIASRAERQASVQAPWYEVMWLTGVDYFSSLAYQAGIALIAAGMLSPAATVLLALVTLCCAVPVYREVARRSYAGQGSIAMLEHLLSGWWSKLFVIVLLGFAGTDFVITMTLSAADSARHAVENPLLKPYIGNSHLAVTIGLLVLLAVVFLRGFGEAIKLAVAVAVPYIGFNIILIARCIVELWRHPALFHNWHNALLARTQGWVSLVIVSGIVFPQLALGLSGFETGVAVMPLIRGDEADAKRKDGTPRGRICNTGKLLLTAALLMSVLLLMSSLVAATLVPESAYREGGVASGRALAYLAHLYLGRAFGSVYDISTIVILWFAGASAMAGLLNLIPRYLPRFGMAPPWVALVRPLVLVLFAIDLAVTLVFRADVNRQAGAYATGVLVLIFSASIAACLSSWQDAPEKNHAPLGLLKAFYFGFCSLVFAYTLVFNVKERPDGIIIASIFIVLLIASSLASRYRRSTELRVQKCEFADGETQRIWETLRTSGVNLVSISTLDSAYRESMRQRIASCYKLEGPLTFVHVSLLDDRSEFYEQLRVKIVPQDPDFLVTVTRANVVANTVAYISLVLRAKNVVLQLSRRGHPLSQMLKYLLFGTGEIGLMVHEILLEHWKQRPAGERPQLLLMSA